ncbi:hypothetical protein NKR74_06260 [Bacillus sp. 3103sda1]|uniref:hypothetical protein n=1 Tax=Bacillus sp. 3103sda1 TaxID=2953808 RepID=UPI00209E4CAA|nr:hypothetical protein [Bacillus sp. 3103sda1]MCP1122940.1 hypothetical protein [Bacillus sp. 3103sda1]
MKWFNRKNETEMEKLQGQASELQATITELSAKINRVERSLELAETDLMLDESATNKKHVEKYKKALESFNNETAKTQEQLNTIAEKIAQIQANEEQSRIESLAELDIKGYESSHRGYKAREVLRIVEMEIDKRTGYLGAGTPDNLLRDIKSPEDLVPYSNFQPHHQGVYQSHIDAWEKGTKEADEQIDKDYQELLQAVNKYFGINF